MRHPHKSNRQFPLSSIGINAPRWAYRDAHLPNLLPTDSGSTSFCSSHCLYWSFHRNGGTVPHFFWSLRTFITELPLQEPLPFLQVSLKQAEWLTMLMSVGFVAILAFLANRTKLGLAWKATVTDPDIASSFGVDIIQVRYLNFSLDLL